MNGRAAPVNGDGAITIDTDRGVLSAPLVVDALGWRRVLACDDGFQPPDAPLSRGLEVHPDGAGEDMEIWIDRRYVPAGYGWSFPAREELRIGVGLSPRASTCGVLPSYSRSIWGASGSATRATGSRTICAAPPREASSLWVTQPDIACHSPPRGSARPSTSASRWGARRELREVVEGRGSRDGAAATYVTFHGSHAWKFRWLLRGQRLLPYVPSRLLGPVILLLGARRFVVDWLFGHYLRIAPPELAAGRRSLKRGSARWRRTLLPAGRRAR